MEAITQLIAKLARDEIPVAETIALLDHPSALVRANAILALAQHLLEDEQIQLALTQAARDPRNSFRLMGTMRVSHLALITLMKADTARFSAATAQLLHEWPQADRYYLAVSMESEGLAAPPFDN